MKSNKKIALCLSLSLLIIFSAGCANSDKENIDKSSLKTTENVEQNKVEQNKVEPAKGEKNENETKSIEEKAKDVEEKTNDQGITMETTNTEEKVVISPDDKAKFELKLSDIRQCAEYGMLTDRKYNCGLSNIYDIEKEWGEPESTNYVDDAKGDYSIYSEHNTVFGWNKGGRVFEIRSTAPDAPIPYYYVVEVLGEPDYSVEVNGEKIIGYKVNDKFKLLLVFEGSSINAKIDHYSVLSPDDTVNSMKGDPGREW